MAESQFNTEYLERIPGSLSITEGILKEARATIDELREQNILMRKILKMIDWDHDTLNDKDINLNRSCAWCGTLYDEGLQQHDTSCLILTIRTLLPTIPEIK